MSAVGSGVSEHLYERYKAEQLYENIFFFNQTKNLNGTDHFQDKYNQEMKKCAQTSGIVWVEESTRGGTEPIKLMKIKFVHEIQIYSLIVNLFFCRVHFFFVSNFRRLNGVGNWRVKNCARGNNSHQPAIEQQQQKHQLLLIRNTLTNIELNCFHGLRRNVPILSSVPSTA